MRHPLSTTHSGGESECPVAVGDVGAFVVPDLLAQAVPQDLQPAVAERAQGGVVPFTSADLAVVELTSPGALTKAAKSPLMHSGAEIMVVSESPCHDEVTFPGTAGYRGLAGVTLQCIRRVELIETLTDFPGDPGSESVLECG